MYYNKKLITKESVLNLKENNITSLVFLLSSCPRLHVLNSTMTKPLTYV